MWLLVVSVMGMSAYSNEYPTYQECADAGRSKAIEYTLRGKTSVTWTCTRQDGAPYRYFRAGS